VSTCAMSRSPPGTPTRAPRCGTTEQADIDYGAWSRHRGNPHAYPPICAHVSSVQVKTLGVQSWVFCADWR
jgi:hypothetical protein